MLAYLPGALLVFLYLISTSKEHRRRYFQLGVVFCGSLIGIISVIYIAAYAYFYQFTAPEEYLVEFLKDEKAKLWLKVGYAWHKFYSLGEGLLRAFFHVPNFGITIENVAGIDTTPNYDLRALLVTILQCLVLLTLIMALSNFRYHRDSKKMTWALTGFIVPPVLAPAYDYITYSKLWLQPLSAVIVLVAYHFSHVLKAPVRVFYKAAACFLPAVFLTFQIYWNYKNVLAANHEGNRSLHGKRRSDREKDRTGQHDFLLCAESRCHL